MGKIRALIWGLSGCVDQSLSQIFRALTPVTDSMQWGVFIKLNNKSSTSNNKKVKANDSTTCNNFSLVLVTIKIGNFFLQQMQVICVLGPLQ